MIFFYLLVFVIMILVHEEVLSIAYGTTFVRDIMMWFAQHPGRLLGIAGVFSLAWLGFRAASFASQAGR